MLKLKDKTICRWDLVALGEVLLRFEPRDARIASSREFRVWDGGGEYNVARGLAKTFRLQTAIATALADNLLGRLAEDLIWQAGVDSSEIIWRAFDGIGKTTRNGVYFIERGFGARAPASVFDRANTAISQLKSGDIDWQRIFGERAARWFHTGGVFCGLSETAPAVALEAMRAAKESNAIVSFDLNYRDSLWRERGGRDAANRLNKTLLAHADIAFGAFDFDSNLANYDQNLYRAAAEKMCAEFPNLKAVVSTLRTVQTASRHDLSAVCFAQNRIFKARDYKDSEVYDRVGSGDAFASGFIYGLLAGKDWQSAIECGAAHACLTMTTPGDNSMTDLSEIESLIGGASANVKR